MLPYHMDDIIAGIFVLEVGPGEQGPVQVHF